MRRARELGMVPGGDPAFLDPDGTVKGVPSPASDAEQASFQMPLVLAPEVIDSATVPTPTAGSTPTETVVPAPEAVPSVVPPPRPRPPAGDGSVRRFRQATAAPPRARTRAPRALRPPRRPTAPGPRSPPGPPPCGAPPGGPQDHPPGQSAPRLRLVGLALTLVLAAFVVRLLQVQAVDASTYAAKAEQNRYVGYTLAAERGGITDRDGVALATSEDAYDITADPTLFTRAELKIDDGPEQAAALLAPILGQDQETIVKKLRPKDRKPATPCSPTARPRRSGSRSRT